MPIPLAYICRRNHDYSNQPPLLECEPRCFKVLANTWKTHRDSLGTPSNTLSFIYGIRHSKQQPAKKLRTIKREKMNVVFKASALSITIYALFALTIIKIVATVFVSPLMGYANNYDFVRQSSCIGIWQSYPDKPSTSANPEAPINSLIFDGHKSRKVCMKSSDNIFPWITAKLHKVGDKIDFREISLWKISFAVVLFSLLLSKTTDQAYRLAISLAFFLVFGDMTNLLYANTLYLEFSVIAGTFFVLFSTTLLISTKSKNTTLIASTIVSLFWLGFSKQQYMPLAIFFGIICAMTMLLKYGDRRLGITFIVIVAATPFIYAKLNRSDSGHMIGVNFANKTDTFLGAVLPESADKEATLLKLGLPITCLKGIGENWYTPGIMQNHPCPEVQHLSRAKLAEVFISDPRTFLEPMRKAIVGLRPFYPDYLGHLTEPNDKNSDRYLLLKKSSLSSALVALPASTMPAIVYGSIFFGIAALGSTCISLRTHACPKPLVLMILFGSAVSFYSIFSSVFGDGYVDLQKHAVGFLVGIAFQVAALVLLLAGWLVNRIPLPETAAAQA